MCCTAVLIVLMMGLSVSPKRSVFWTCEAPQRSGGCTTSWGQFHHLLSTAAAADTERTCLGGRLDQPLRWQLKKHNTSVLHVNKNACAPTLNRSVWNQIPRDLNQIYKIRRFLFLSFCWFKLICGLCASITFSMNAYMWCAYNYSSVLHMNNTKTSSWLYLGSGQRSTSESKMALSPPARPIVK